MAEQMEPKDSPKKDASYRSLVLSIVTLCAALAVTIFATIAWFANNKSVDSDGMRITLGANSYQLQATGDSAGAYASFLENRGIPFVEHGATGGFTTIQWNMSETSNFRNIGEAEKPESMLRPGASGQLTFRIIPPVDVDTSGKEATLRLTLTPYEGFDNSLHEINDASVVNLLKGHLLFFRQKSDGTYSRWLRHDDMTFKTTEFGKDITIYWVWPMLYDSLVYNDDYPQYFLFQRGSTTASEISEDVNANESYYFRAPTEDEGKNDRSANYDRGDQHIGLTVNYLGLTLSLEEVSQYEETP